jgi:hypothetical protein
MEGSGPSIENLSGCHNDEPAEPGDAAHLQRYLSSDSERNIIAGVASSDGRAAAGLPG